MQPTRSNTARLSVRNAATTTPPALDATPESPPQTRPPRPQPTPDDAPAPAESVRVIDRPAGEGGRAYLVERELETNSELDALIADYLQQATKLDSPPLALCPLENDPEATA